MKTGLRAFASSRRRHAQLGLSLIELMVAIAIGLFVMLGLSAVFINMKTSFVGQKQLADLQDSERLALTVLTTTIQSARYFPDPSVRLPIDALPALPTAVPEFGPGQGISGTSGASASDPDQIFVRYVRAPSDGLMDCLGQANTTGATAEVINAFKVDVATKELQCSVDGGTTWVPLVSGVRLLKVLYAVDPNPPTATGSGNAETYMDAAAVEAAGLWLGVRSAQVTLSFDSPFPTAGAGTLDWTQTINVMNQI